ncbi:MAG: NAD(P)/FAD-dependent oxidoreductase [Proteobacteria bacterium]|nr:NAD(P)/FAD-dependent oxidoreductase [Pseudomonadota bacterium]
MDAQPTPTDAAADLARRVASDLEYLCLPPPNWPAAVPGPDGKPMLDVLVIGAGMCGIAAAAALIFKGVRNIAVIDANPDGREGPWVTYARMETLRSPKHLPGPALGIPSLTFRSWYEATQGREAWDALYKIPNAIWQDYLTWLKRALALPVRNGVAAMRLEPGGGHVTALLSDGTALRARRVVVATGRPGTGGNSLPEWVAPELWPDRAAHTADDIDFAALRGKRIAVVGGGASAWDNAATALEAGAAQVTMYVRRPVLPQVNKGRGSATPGYFEGWGALDPAQRWEMLAYMNDVQSPPPHETVFRTIRHDAFALRLGTPVLGASRDGAGVALRLAHGTETADFLILGTGFAIDLGRDALLGPLGTRLATWADRYAPPPALRRDELGRFPWLGPAFELTEREPGADPDLPRIHLFNHAATLSLGAIASDIPGVNAGAERLAGGIVRQLFREDYTVMHERLVAFAEPELIDTPFFAL